jgi:hypothetical protein
MPYLPRKLSGVLGDVRARFPAVLVTGPRQSGKTTFMRHEAPECAYVTFDDPLNRQFAARDPHGFLDQFGSSPVVLDEVQYVPDLFPYLKMRIDADRSIRGRFLLTGSQQFAMMRHVGDSLAGRLALLDLLPFSWAEAGGSTGLGVADVLWRGGYPPVYLDPAARDAWLRGYVQTYLERDVRNLQNIRDLRLFETFLGLLAARHAQTANRAEVARDCGVSQPAVRDWENVLIASYILFPLPPYHRNFGKRLVKTPKLYFVDSGLAAWLTRQPSAEALWRGPMGGAFFEGWVVSEAVKAFAARGRRPDVFFWRSSDGVEVDLLIEAGGRLHAVEIKQTATPTAVHADVLTRWAHAAGRAPEGDRLLVCTCRRETALPNGVRALPWHAFPAWMDRILKGPRP